MTDKHVFASDENTETYQDCDVSLVSGYVVVRNIVQNLTACAAVQTRNKVHVNTKSTSGALYLHQREEPNKIEAAQGIIE